MVDEGSGMIVNFDPTGMVKMVLGRKPEAVDYLEKYVERGEGHRALSIWKRQRIQPANGSRMGCAGQYLCSGWL
jgi:hypothetical protein